MPMDSHSVGCGWIVLRLALIPARKPKLPVVIGGGISGAGVAQQAARRGWKVLLVEQRVLHGAPPAGRPSWCMADCVT